VRFSDNISLALRRYLRGNMKDPPSSLEPKAARAPSASLSGVDGRAALDVLDGK
jgi:hypothetical protein